MKAHNQTKTTEWPYKLGDKLRDAVTGYTGICIARTEWMNGCFRFTLQAPLDKDGKIVAAETSDDAQLELVEEASVAVRRKDTGGPTPAPQRTTAIKP